LAIIIAEFNLSGNSFAAGFASIFVEINRGPARRTTCMLGRMANAPRSQLNIGETAPDFSAATNGGGRIALSGLRGQYVVLYFYPRDDTPGCTKEACAFRDAFEAFKRKNAAVIGVSTDTVKAHDKFATKFQLPFILVSDEDRRIVDAYGVWGEKTFMGRKYMGTHRVTFLIGPDGIIRNIWPKVTPAEHPAEILAALP
jgi:peroxiredoxin Q/BCP